MSVTLKRQIHHKMDAGLLTWYFEWQKSVVTKGFEVIFFFSQELQNLPELRYQFSRWSRDTACSLTSCRAVEGKIPIASIQSSAVPQLPVFPWLLSLPSRGFSHPRAQPSAEGSDHSLSREGHVPRHGCKSSSPKSSS